MRALCLSPVKRRLASTLMLLPGVLALSACTGEAEPAESAATPDPVIARALNDPLMVDPDLAYRNQAAAALSTGVDHALPVLSGNAAMARRARDEMRLALLEDGAILDLPDMTESEEGVSLAGIHNAEQMALTHDVPEDCAKQLRAGFIWAARLDDAASLMPFGHVRAAAGAENEKCSIRAVSYLTAAEGKDVLLYHYNLARRAELNTDVFAKPELALAGSSEDARLAVNIREGNDAMRVVDLIFWKTSQ